nr:hypothetical protein [Lachnospiraceae bacterium]
MKKKANRILSFILLWSMLLGCVPQSVFAAEPEETMEVTEAVSENTVDSVSGDEAAAEETVSGNAAESVSTDEASEEEKEEAASGNAAEEVSGNGASEEESVSGNETPSENEALSENEAAEENVSENNAEELPEESPEPEEPLEPEIVGDTYVYHVSEVYYLDDAFNSTGAGRTTRIVLTRDLDFGFEGMMKGDPGAIVTFNVRGNVILDFNGHKITGKMSGQYHDTISTWSFLHFYLCMGDLYYYENDSEKAASLTFEDSVGGGGIFIKAVTEKDTPLQAVDISVRNYYTYIFRDGVIGQQSGAEAIDGMKVTVNGGIFQLESEVLSGGDGSRDDYTAADDEETVTGIRETDFTRSAFSIKNVCDVEINGGTFIAIGGDETARRELSAFGIIDRYLGPLGNRPESGLRINGGIFIGENCYALKGYRFITSSSKAIESVSDCPRIRGGYFNGGICFTGKDYRDVDDYKKGVVNFSINRANSATMLFDEDSNLYIAGVSAQASDYTWQDLEMMSVIELFPASCAEIESVAINGDVMSADDVYWTESGTELFITSEAAAMPDWVKSGYSEAYDKSGFYVYNINNLGTPVHQEVQ